MITNVRKPPNVPQIHRKPDDRKEKVHLFAPFVPGVRLGDSRPSRGVVGAVAGVRGAVLGESTSHDRWVLFGAADCEKSDRSRSRVEEDADKITKAEWEELVERLGYLLVEKNKTLSFLKEALT